MHANNAAITSCPEQCSILARMSRLRADRHFGKFARLPVMIREMFRSTSSGLSPYGCNLRLCPRRFLFFMQFQHLPNLARRLPDGCIAAPHRRVCARPRGELSLILQSEETCLDLRPLMSAVPSPLLGVKSSSFRFSKWHSGRESDVANGFRSRAHRPRRRARSMTSRLLPSSGSLVYRPVLMNGQQPSSESGCVQVAHRGRSY
ncbi:hypothetical protein EJ04DRAFT_51450 [Polyplosphaeria fusca]|uniref:Uncharacterized protein n=1 Tax=Polyplosphaeria fusca TaxID=682080 RepID=A0A9P4V7E9_9PLEO|nr:hypothetical protein EJ04DRAFT_51450 [Polyplosphaeria fusca]